MAKCKPKGFTKGGKVQKFALGGAVRRVQTQSQPNNLTQSQLNNLAATRLTMGPTQTPSTQGLGNAAQQLSAQQQNALGKIGTSFIPPAQTNRAVGAPSQGLASAAQQFNAQQQAALGKFGAGLGSQSAMLGARPFKKGGMVNAKGKGSSVRPRGASGKGVKPCKVC